MAYKGLAYLHIQQTQDNNVLWPGFSFVHLTNASPIFTFVFAVSPKGNARTR